MNDFNQKQDSRTSSEYYDVSSLLEMSILKMIRVVALLLVSAPLGTPFLNTVLGSKAYHGDE